MQFRTLNERSIARKQSRARALRGELGELRALLA